MKVTIDTQAETFRIDGVPTCEELYKIMDSFCDNWNYNYRVLFGPESIPTADDVLLKGLPKFVSPFAPDNMDFHSRVGVTSPTGINIPDMPPPAGAIPITNNNVDDYIFVTRSGRQAFPCPGREIKLNNGSFCLVNFSHDDDVFSSTNEYGKTEGVVKNGRLLINEDIVKEYDLFLKPKP